MLDLKTLFVTLAVITTFVGLALFFYGKNSKTYPGFHLWAIGTFFAAISYIAMLLRGGAIPVWASILIVNGAAVLAGLFRLDGVTRFLRGKSLARMYYASFPVAVLFAGYFHFIRDSVIIRTAALAGWACLFTWAIAALFIRSESAGTRLLNYTAGGINIAYGLSMLVRTVLNAQNGGSAILESNAPNAVFFSSVIVYEIWLGQLIMMMNSRRMEQELKLNEEELRLNVDRLGKAMSEVKVLKGLLPICATCKKIRDDRGYWKQLEWYIDEHSEATFTHGICPECADDFRKEVEVLQHRPQ